MDIYKQAELIKSQDDFNMFLKNLIKDFENNFEEWDNNDLLSFLKGLYGYSSDKIQDKLEWNTFAEILLGSIVYE